jgi:hypothetical protein
MIYKTYSGKPVEGVLTGIYRPLTRDEIAAIDDSTTEKIGTLPGTGDLITHRIAHYYIAGILIDGKFNSALLHVDDIIAAHAGKNRIRGGYRAGSLKIYYQSENKWYCWTDGESENSVTDADSMAFNHLTGTIDINAMIEYKKKELVTMSRLPATPKTELFKAKPEESDNDFAGRIMQVSDYIRLLQQAQQLIALDKYHLI